MNNNFNREPAEEILRLARRIRRLSAHNEELFNRQDRLRLLLLEHEPISLRGLARLMDIRPPSLSEWIEKLIEAGEISKERDEDDRRMIRLSLTEEGKELALASKEKERAVSIFADCLTAEEEQAFSTICAKLHEHLDIKRSELADRHGSKKHHHGERGGSHHPGSKRSKHRGRQQREAEAIDGAQTSGAANEVREESEGRV